MPHSFPNFVPRSLQMDAWWMSADSASGGGGVYAAPPDVTKSPPFWQFIAIIVLLPMADRLLWDAAPGL